MSESFSAYWSEDLGEAIKRNSTDSYSMSLVAEDARSVKAAVNQGIDSRLEACFAPSRGDSYEWDGRRMNCEVSPESLPVLVRRLLEDGDDEGMSLASGICSTLGIELI